MASKNIIAELNKGEKLNGDSYDIWHLKMQYVLDEQEALEVVNNVMEEPKVGDENVNNAQLRRDMAGFNAWKKKDSTARGILYIITLDDDEEPKTLKEALNVLPRKSGKLH